MKPDLTVTYKIELEPVQYFNCGRGKARRWASTERKQIDRALRAVYGVGPYSRCVRVKAEIR